MINTLKYAQRLEAAGFSRSQAEAQALVIQDALDDSMQPFATKSDLNIAVTRLDAKIDRLETRLRSEISSLDTNLRSEISSLDTNLRSEISSLDTTLRSEISSLDTTLRSEISNLDTTLRSEVGRVETTLGSSIRELQSDMHTVKWILGLMVPALITLLIPAIQSIYLQLHAN
ncbi:MAG: coiled-coil domain-containing protein [Betaproteobacteria bacterium]